MRKILWDLLCEKRYCATDVKSKTLWERRKKKIYIGISYDNVGRMILWGKRSDNDIVQMKLWALRCANDDVRKKIWERRCEKHVETGIVRKKVWERGCRTDFILSYSNHAIDFVCAL